MTMTEIEKVYEKQRERVNKERSRDSRLPPWAKLSLEDQKTFERQCWFVSDVIAVLAERGRR